ncbi:MAG: 5-deoxy-glucuronate isomerase, partial [Actinocatenispora sp.]
MNHHQPSGSSADGPWTVRTRMDHTSLRIVRLAPGDSVEIATGDEEILVVPLSGGCVIGSGADTVELAGRPDVFSGVTDFGYLPRSRTARLGSAGGGRFALA